MLGTFQDSEKFSENRKTPSIALADPRIGETLATTKPTRQTSREYSNNNYNTYFIDIYKFL